MSNDLLRDETLLRLTKEIGRLPDLDPPGSLLTSVMAAVRTKKRPWRHRLYSWARAPRSITFTPLQLAPALGMLVVACVASLVYFSGQKGSSLPQAGLSAGAVPIRLSLDMPDAGRVAVVGSFNQWYGKGYEMQYDSSRASWTLTVWLPEGRYEYAFVVDEGRILPDPGAPIYQDDGFGNQNSVLIVGKRDDSTI